MSTNFTITYNVISINYRDKEIDEELEKQKRKKRATTSGLGPLPAPSTDKKYNVCIDCSTFVLYIRICDFRRFNYILWSRIYLGQDTRLKSLGHFFQTIKYQI